MGCKVYVKYATAYKLFMNISIQSPTKDRLDFFLFKIICIHHHKYGDIKGAV